MPIALNAEMLAAAYDYLCCQKPFAEWNLPPAEDVKFAVTKKKDRYAHHQMVGGVHHIVVSSHFVGRHEILLATLAHELVHVHQQNACISSRNPHGTAFQRFADRICRIHEFDRLTF